MGAIASRAARAGTAATTRPRAVRGRSPRPDGPPDPAELRAEIARAGVTLYHVGAAANVAPGYLGAMLRGRLPLTAAVRKRVLDALSQIRR
jgi:hypothetical protein